MRRFLLLLAFLPLLADAAILSTTGTAADAQTQVTAAANGDTIQWPLNGNLNWSSGDHITTGGKYLIFDGNGSTINGTGGTVAFQFETVAGGSLLVENFTFLPNASGWGGSNGIIQIGFNGGSGTFANPTPRITNCTFTQSNVGVGGTFISCYFCWPLIDHCSFTADDAAEMIHNFGWFSGNSTGWSQTITPGSASATYLEDCTFSKTTLTSSSNAAAGAFQSYTGSRLVVRHNTINYLQGDIHGTSGEVWTRWWEIYANNWVMPSGSHNLQLQCDLRGGSGVFFANTHSGGTNTGLAYVQVRAETPIITAASRSANVVTITCSNTGFNFFTTGQTAIVTGMTGFTNSPNGTFTITHLSATQISYASTGANESFTFSGATVYQSVMPFQIGNGKSPNAGTPWDTNQASDPAYFWNNSFVGTFSNQSPLILADGANYFSSTQKPNYTPFQYPYLGSYPTSATINSAGTTLTIVWPKTMTDGGGGRNGFTWMPSGGASTIAYSIGTGTSTYVYSLSRVILTGETFGTTGLAYAQPGSGIQVPASGTIQALTDVGSWPQSAGSGTFFNGFTVTNNSTATAGPTATSASVNAAGTTLTVNWSASVTNGADLTGMKVTIGGSDYTATYASGSGSTATTYTVAKVYSTAMVTNKYTQSGTGLVATSGGAQVQTYSGLAVTNNSTQTFGGAPTIGTATATGSSTITVTWTDNSAGAASFKAYRSLTNSGFVSVVGSPAIGMTSFGDTGLSASTQYFYVVSAVVPGVESAQSSSANATTSGSGAPTTSGTQGLVKLVGAAMMQ